MLRLVVLLSGRGSNFISIEQSIAVKSMKACIDLVISDNADAAGLDYAKSRGLPTAIVQPSAYNSKAEFNSALLQTAAKSNANWAVLAGYMRLVDKQFIAHFNGQVINIHPSLLPDHKGLNTHQRVIDAGEQEHGASVHIVTPELDDGPIIVQATVQVMPDDDAQSLAARVLEKEHLIYPQTIEWLSDGTLQFYQGDLYFNQKKMQKPLTLN